MDTVHKPLARRLRRRPGTLVEATDLLKHAMQRGDKRTGAAVSTYLALPGMVLVTMPDADGLATMLRKGVLPNAVLALIARRPRYGLEIVRKLREAGLVNGEGTVYPILARLREDGLVTTEWQEAVAGPPRRYYAATGDGLQQLAAFRRAWFAFVATVEEILEEEAGPWSTAQTR